MVTQPHGRGYCASSKTVLRVCPPPARGRTHGELPQPGTSLPLTPRPLPIWCVATTLPPDRYFQLGSSIFQLSPSTAHQMCFRTRLNVVTRKVQAPGWEGQRHSSNAPDVPVVMGCPPRTRGDIQTISAQSCTGASAHSKAAAAHVPWLCHGPVWSVSCLGLGSPAADPEILVMCEEVFPEKLPGSAN